MLHISLREQCYIYNCWSNVTNATLYHCTSSAAFIIAMLQCYVYHCGSNATITTLYRFYHCQQTSVLQLHCIVDVGDLQMGMMSIIRTRWRRTLSCRTWWFTIGEDWSRNFSCFPLQICPIVVMSLKTKTDKRYYHKETKVWQPECGEAIV